MTGTPLTKYLCAIRDFIVDRLKNPAVLLKFLLVSGSAVVINLLISARSNPSSAVLNSAVYGTLVFRKKEDC